MSASELEASLLLRAWIEWRLKQVRLITVQGLFLSQDNSRRSPKLNVNLFKIRHTARTSGRLSRCFGKRLYNTLILSKRLISSALF